jgi:hypothetical protein
VVVMTGGGGTTEHPQDMGQPPELRIAWPPISGAPEAVSFPSPQTCSMFTSGVHTLWNFLLQLPLEERTREGCNDTFPFSSSDCVIFDGFFLCLLSDVEALS